MTVKPVLIFANGEMRWPLRLKPFHRGQFTIYCADGGADRCLEQGIQPDLLIGDLDSVSPASLQHIESLGIPVRRYERNKDQTDLELAIEHAIGQGVRDITLLGILGGRLDHLLANVALCARSAYEQVRFSILDGSTSAFRLCAGQQSLSLQGRPGDLVSLIPLSPQVKGVKSSGLKWALSGALLEFGSPLTVSNEMSAAEASVSIEDGVLLVIYTGDSTAGPEAPPDSE